MQQLQSYIQYIEDSLQELQPKGTPVELYEPIHYLLSIGGKRLRPVLTLLGAELFGVPNRQVIHQALAVEVFHNFTLMHDDIMDNAPLRRGKATVHEAYNTNTAILSGDVMLVESYNLLFTNSGEKFSDLFQLFNQTAREVCEGQQFDMNFETQNNVSISEYINMIRLKTSVLLGAALQLGAIMANTNKTNAELIYEFGKNLGIAFQLKDDYLDVYGDPKKFGKQVGGDILANKKTFLLLKAFELANPTQQAELESWLNTHNQPKEKVAAVTQLFTALNIPQHANEIMDEYYQKSLAALGAIKAEAKNKEKLQAFAAWLMQRES